MAAFLIRLGLSGVGKIHFELELGAKSLFAVGLAPALLVLGFHHGCGGKARSAGFTPLRKPLKP